jgi:hypothetical protein
LNIYFNNNIYHTTMKNITSILMLSLVFFAFGCNQAPSTAPTNGAKVNDSKHPTNAGGGDACFDIPTPAWSGNGAGVTQGAAIGNNYAIKVCWTYTVEPDAYYTQTQYKPQGNKPYRAYGSVPTAALNPGAVNSPYEFWGGSQNSIVSSPSYSGHYDVSGQYSTDGGTTWVDIGEVETTSLCLTDNNGGNGYPVGTIVHYSVEEKSNEGSSPNDCTHHSQTATSSDFTVTQPCVEVVIPNTYAMSSGAAGGSNGTWNASGSMWTANNSSTNQNANINFTVKEWTSTQNSCTHVITSTPVTGGYTGPIYLSIDGGTTWRTETYDVLNSSYKSNGNNPGGNGSGLGKFTLGDHTVLVSLTPSLAGQVTSFTLHE